MERIRSLGRYIRGNPLVLGLNLGNTNLTEVSPDQVAAEVTEWVSLSVTENRTRSFDPPSFPWAKAECPHCDIHG